MGKDRSQDSSPSLLTSYSNRTEGPSTDGVQCGRWLLRSTCVRRRRRQPVSLKFEPSTPTSKRKRRDTSSPTPSANSFTGENSVQVAHKDAAKFIGKGLDHYDLLHELLDGSLATGVFGQPSPLGAPSLEQEQQLRNQGKAIKFSDSTFSDGRKRMSDGSGGPSSKSIRSEQKEAYDRVAFANQKKGEYFETLTQRLEAQNYSIEACLQVMNPLKEFVSDTAFYKAYDKLLEGVNYREGFIKLTPDGRLGWISRFGSGN